MILRTAERRRNPRRRSRGQALVEFALIAPLFFVCLLGIAEAGRFIFYNEMLNNATREGARYAIVHGANSALPSGPNPGNLGDVSGDNVMLAVRNAALSLASVGELGVFPPVWTIKGWPTTPNPGDSSNGSNARGDYVTVFVEFTYDPIIKQILNFSVLPTITLNAESTLVVNN